MRKTPWGIAQSKHQYTRGINFYSTARHGGFCVSKTHLDKMHPSLRSIGTHDGWFEEDCASAVVYVSFPKLFTGSVVQQAHKTLVNYYPDQYSEAYNVPIPITESYELRRREFFKQSRNKFIVRSAMKDSDNPKQTNVYAINRKTNETRYFAIPSSEYKPGEFGFVIENETQYKELSIT